MENVSALHAHDASLDAEWWHQDVRAVVLDDLAHLVEALEQDGVQLSVSDHNGLHEDLCLHDQVVQTLLGAQNAFRVLTGDVDQVVRSALGPGRRVAEQAGERRREVDGRAGGRLDDLDVLAATPTNQCVHGQLELHGVDVALELWRAYVSPVR